MHIREMLKFGNYRFDPQQKALLQGDALVPLSPKTLETLEILLAARGCIVGKDEFMRRMWPDTFVEESNLTQNIFILRKTLGRTVSGRSYVETVPKRGYRLAAPIEVCVKPTDDAAHDEPSPQNGELSSSHHTEGIHSPLSEHRRILPLSPRVAMALIALGLLVGLAGWGRLRFEGLSVTNQ